MKIVSTTYEHMHKNYTYRLIEDAKGVLIRRTHNDNMLWGHGVLTQMLDEDGTFKMGIAVNKPKYLKSLKEAVQLIEGQE